MPESESRKTASVPTLPKAVTYFAALAPQRVDVENGKILGMCLMKAGPALGHGTAVDGTTLTQLASQCQALGKVSFVEEHDGKVMAVIGELSNFRVEGDTTRGDLDVYKNYPNRDQFLEIADRNPAAFGTSAEFRRTDETVGTSKFARVHAVRRFALERDPAAAPNGLFSENHNPEDIDMTKDELKAAFAEAIQPLSEKVTALETQFSAVPKPPTAEEIKARDEALVLDGLTKFAAKVGLKEAPKNHGAQGGEGGAEGNEPSYLTKFKKAKEAAPNVGIAITRFAADNPKEFDAWHIAGRPGL